MITRNEALACAERENYGDGLIDFANLVRYVSKNETLMSKSKQQVVKPLKSETLYTVKYSTTKKVNSKPRTECVDALQDRLAKTFQLYDRDGDGLVTKDEIKKTLREQGLSDNLSSYQASELIKTADENGDGYQNCSGRFATYQLHCPAFCGHDVNISNCVGDTRTSAQVLSLYSFIL